MVKFCAPCVKYGTLITQTAKGMDNMTYSKDTIRFADHLVSYYSKYDNSQKKYELSWSDINDFDLHELSSFILLDDPMYALESTGPDNPYYEKSMLPALIKFMGNTTDREAQREFNIAWKDGIKQYHEKVIEELLEERLEIYNFYQDCAVNEDTQFIVEQRKENRTWIR